MTRTFYIFTILLILQLGTVRSVYCQPQNSETDEIREYKRIVRIINKKDYLDALIQSCKLIESTNKHEYLYSRIIESLISGQQTSEIVLVFDSALKSGAACPTLHYGIGLAYAQQKEYSKAISEYKSCINARPNFLAPLIELVNAYNNQRNTTEAESYIKMLLQNSPNSSEFHIGLGYYYLINNSTELAIRETGIAYEINPKLPEACFHKSNTLWVTRRFRDSAMSANQCASTAKTEMDQDRWLQFAYVISSNFLNLGIASNALPFLKEAITLAQNIENKRQEERLTAYLAYTHEMIDNSPMAILHYKQAIKLNQQMVDNSYYLARHLTGIGRAYYSIGDYSSAAQYFQTCLQVSTEAKYSDGITAAMSYLGDISISQGDLLKATSYYEQINNNNIPPVIQNRILESLAKLYLKTRRYYEAQKVIQQSLQIAKSLSSFDIEIAALNNLGETYLCLDQTKEAIETYQESLQMALDKDRVRHAWIACFGLATAYNKMGMLNQAYEHYLKATQIIESLRSRLAAEEEKVGFFQDKVKIYKDLVATLIELHGKEAAKGYDAEAFDYAERARGRGFLDLLAEAKVNLDQNLDPTLLEKRQIIQNELSKINLELVAERSKELSKQDSSKLKQLEKALSDANEKLDNWVRDVRLSDPRYAALKFPKPIKLPEAQKLLNNRSAMLAFSLGEQESFLFAVTRNDYRVFKLKSSSAIRQNVDDLLNAVQGKGRANSPMGTFKTSARELYQSLIEPAKDLLAGKSELIVVPDESLHRLPFEVLLTGKPEGKWEQLPYLVRDFAISYAPSVSVLSFLKTQPQHTAPKDFVAFGDPIVGKDDQMNDQAKMLASAIRKDSSKDRSLVVKPERFALLRKLFGSSTRGASTGPLRFDRLPFSRDEAIEIAGLFPAGKADVFLGKDATEEKAKTKDLLSQYGIVHFSTHGLPNEDRPRFSSLIMSSPVKGETASETVEDGWLSAYEIFNLKLNANLVVLSACETGLGKEVRGEGLMSLTRAFMYAGAPSVVVSLWKVNDAASKDLMVAFYRHLQQPVNGEKLGYSEALRRAQLEMIGKGNSPKFWAPFVLVGKP